jgi:uncharacterized protein YjbI with pentapeptide repeats
MSIDTDIDEMQDKIEGRCPECKSLPNATRKQECSKCSSFQKYTDCTLSGHTFINCTFKNCKITDCTLIRCCVNNCVITNCDADVIGG